MQAHGWICRMRPGPLPDPDGPQIFVDASFNQARATRIIRFRQSAQRDQARPEPRHVSSRKPPLYHEQCCKPSVPAKAEQ